MKNASFRTNMRCGKFLHVLKHTIAGPHGALWERSVGADPFQIPRGCDTGQHVMMTVTFGFAW
jgi:hypothetical protein